MELMLFESGIWCEDGYIDSDRSWTIDQNTYSLPENHVGSSWWYNEIREMRVLEDNK